MDTPDKALHRDYASAAEAMKILNVRQQTLYAYVSRGWIRSVAQQGQKGKLYLRDDLTRVGMRSLARSGHGAVAASAMNWGEPIFPTSITEITEQGPRYRGHLAADLVRSGASFEAVAELLWTGEAQSPGRKPGPCASLPPNSSTLAGYTDHATGTRQRAGVLRAGGAAAGHAARLGGRAPVAGKTLPAAREIMQTVVACCGFVGAAHSYSAHAARRVGGHRPAARPGRAAHRREQRRPARHADPDGRPRTAARHAGRPCRGLRRRHAAQLPRLRRCARPRASTWAACTSAWKTFWARPRPRPRARSSAPTSSMPRARAFPALTIRCIPRATRAPRSCWRWCSPARTPAANCARSRALSTRCAPRRPAAPAGTGPGRHGPRHGPAAPGHGRAVCAGPARGLGCACAGAARRAGHCCGHARSLSHGRYIRASA